ncbi:retrovirus-related pol polyprotein from transposon TNT 1-94 [Tanacetum coccineum]
MLVPNVSPPANINAQSLQELEFLFSPLFEEYFTARNQSVPKTDHSNNKCNAEENNNDQAADAQIYENEFYNIFSTPVREEAELSTRYVDNSNMHTFYQRHQSEHRWTKDHPLEQVRGNPSKPVQTRRQLATGPEICMFALTMSTAELKNIKEAMADSAWIKTMQDELHHGSLKEEVYVAQPDGFIDPDHLEKVYCLRKALHGLKQALRAWYDELLNLLMSKGFNKGLQIHQFPRGIFINQAKYTLEILKNHGMERCESLGTPLAAKPKLDEDLSGKPVDQKNTVDYGFKLTAFSDVDHARGIDTSKRTSEGIQFLGDKLVSWMSKKQVCTAMSSAEAECVASSASCAQVERGIIELYFVRTKYQLADMFTKALPEDRFQYLVRRIGMRCLTPAKLEVLANESA